MASFGLLIASYCLIVTSHFMDTISAKFLVTIPANIHWQAVCTEFRICTGANFMELPKYMSKVMSTRLPMDGGRCIWLYMEGDQ